MGLTAWQKRRVAEVESPPLMTESGGGTDNRPPMAEPQLTESTMRVQPPMLDPESDISTLNWNSLLERIEACTRCPLHKGRTHAVPGVG